MNKLDKVTNYVAGAGVTYPAWQQHLDQWGMVAGSLVPILSVGWLALQIFFYLRKQWRARA